MSRGKTVNRIKVKGKYFILSLVCLVLGFMVAFSYHLTQTKLQNEKRNLSGNQYEETLGLRNQLIAQEETNRKLQKELNQKQGEVLKNEKNLSKETESFLNLTEDAEKYRMFLGKVKVKGKGVRVTLSDGAYNPKEDNVNNYLVHEQHVFKVITELYISGAAAVAINGQRLTSHSYIVCNGPVITVDGVPYPAPFVITAIGDPDVLSTSLNLTGGVKDQLVNDNVVFSMEKEDEIVLNPILGS
ncbi:DUF881 domain-containing protein [Neobacillus drentensis]|uniref:DUF881 domain-containing protein n=1 Tax=Neobacillus drentensis TaxID=220684 RepID=UPI001F2D4399|nr:DUF881 domain-containing protein [Neobacillus drentensis]ULT58502.1 DUF881 domain-containing protein [Neobacillus drentensis]